MFLTSECGILHWHDKGLLLCQIERALFSGMMPHSSHSFYNSTAFGKVLKNKMEEIESLGL